MEHMKNANVYFVYQFLRVRTIQGRIVLLSLNISNEIYYIKQKSCCVKAKANEGLLKSSLDSVLSQIMFSMPILMKKAVFFARMLIAFPHKTSLLWNDHFLLRFSRERPSYLSMLFLQKKLWGVLLMNLFRHLKDLNEYLICLEFYFLLRDVHGKLFLNLWFQLGLHYIV